MGVSRVNPKLLVPREFRDNCGFAVTVPARLFLPRRARHCASAAAFLFARLACRLQAFGPPAQIPNPELKGHGTWVEAFPRAQLWCLGHWYALKPMCGPRLSGSRADGQPRRQSFVEPAIEGSGVIIIRLPLTPIAKSTLPTISRAQGRESHVSMTAKRTAPSSDCRSPASAVAGIVVTPPSIERSRIRPPLWFPEK
jgi:hypothetical protein